MQVKVERLGKTSFTVETRGHLLLADQPKGNGGTDLAMTPPELMLAALGTCVAYYVAQYCDAQKLDSNKVEVEVSGEVIPEPPRIGKILLRIRVPPELAQDRLKALLRVATHCTIHNTLLNAPNISVEVESPTVLAG